MPNACRSVRCSKLLFDVPSVSQVSVRRERDKMEYGAEAMEESACPCLRTNGGSKEWNMLLDARQSRPWGCLVVRPSRSSVNSEQARVANAAGDEKRKGWLRYK